MKRKICILAAFVLLLNIALVSADNVNKASQNIYLTLEEALQSLEKANPDIKLLDRKLLILERQHRDALARAEYAKDKTSPLQSDNIAYRKDELLNWKKSLYSLNNFKQDREETLRSLRSNTTKKYLDALILQGELVNIQKELSILDKNIEQLRLKIKLGTAKAIDLKGLEAQRLQLVSQLNGTQRQYDLDLLNLKKDLGIPSADKLYLSSAKQDLKLLDDNNIDERIAKAVQNSYSLKIKQQELELTKLEYNIIAGNAIVNLPPEANSLETSIKDKEAALEEEKLAQEASLWNAYYSLKNLEDDVQIKTFDAEIAQLELDTAAAKAKLGMVTELELSNKRLSLARSSDNLARKINEYMQAADNFRVQLGE